MKQWIWVTNDLDELNLQLTNAAMFCDDKATIDIAYNHKIGDRSKYVNVAYQLVRENVDPGKVCLLHVESAEYLANIWTKRLPQKTLRKLGTAIMDAK
jgi:hypothetical protein